MKRFLAAVLTSLLSFLIPLARADVPRTIPLQAIVASPSGVRVDGVRSVTFTLYDSGGVSRWTETKDLTITQGLLTTMLGDTTAFPALFPFDGAYTLGISVGGDPEMTPRLPLGIVPYAHYALAVPWSGISGIPAGFSDGVDNDTTYTAGAGLSLTGTAFSINTAGAQASQSVMWNGANVVWGNPLASALVLPYAGSVSAPQGTPAISITSTGAGRAGYFEVNNPNSNIGALAGKTNGVGHAGYFLIDNVNNTGAAVLGYTNGTGKAVYGWSIGTGEAGLFQISNSANTSDAVYATTNGTGNAMYGYTTGTGRAGTFEVNRTTSYASAVAGKTNGLGTAGYFQIDNTASANSAVYGYTNGKGSTISASNVGTGDAGSFHISNYESTADAVEARTNGVGDAVRGVNSYSGSGRAYGVHGEANSQWGRGVFGYAGHTTGANYGVWGESESVSGTGVLGISYHSTGWTHGVMGSTFSPNGYGVFSNGDLYVDGDITATGSKAGYVADTVLNDDTEPLSPGDVVEITGAADPIQGDIPVMRVRKARTQGSTAVLGPVDCVLNTAPMEEMDARLPKRGKGHMHAHRSEGDIPVGGYGRVVTLGAFRTVKVDASSGPIRPGDLLVSSGRPGYAIAALRPEIGTVIGKALGALESGMGEIAIFVSPR